MSRGGRPLELPGLYWDDEKQRYFPVASKPKNKTTASADSDERQPPLKNVVDDSTVPSGSAAPRAPVAKMLREMRKGTLSYSGLVHVTHQMHGTALVLSSSELKPTIRPCHWYNNKLSSLHAASLDGTLNLLIGDVSGTLHCSRVHPLPQSVTPLPNTPEGIYDSTAFNDNARIFTSYSTGSGNPVSHIARWDNTAVAISSAYQYIQLCVRDLRAADDDGICLPRIKRSGDVWAANLLASQLVLGMARKMNVIEHLDTGSVLEINTIPMESDVLSLAQLPNVILAGCRNGEIRLFDVRSRENRSQGDKILGDRYARVTQPTDRNKRKKGYTNSGAKNHSAITNLRLVRDWELLVATSSGSLELFDRRFCSPAVEPIMSFEGHVNSHLLDLGIAIDPSSSFLFATGQDCRIRGWSLRSGEALTNGDADGDALLGGLQLESPARELQVTDGPMRLWALQDQEIRTWRLGGLS